MTEHTPGPWKVAETVAPQLSDSGLVFIVAPDGNTVCVFAPHMKGRDANAALISSAPDLLAACRAALKWVANNTPMADSDDPTLGPIADGADDVRQKLREAISGAEKGR